MQEHINVLQLIATSNFITVNKTLIRILGLEEAVVLGELLSELDYWKKQKKLERGYFYSTVENIEEITTLTRHKQAKVLKKLQQLDIIDVKYKGMPAKRYVKINELQMLKLLSTQILNVTTNNNNLYKPTTKRKL